MNTTDPLSNNQRALNAIGKEIFLPLTPANLDRDITARLALAKIPVKVTEVKHSGQWLSVQAEGEEPFNIKFSETGL